MRRNILAAVELARDYLRRGWQPVPIDRGQKMPRDKAWQSLAITEANVEDYFSDDDNVGVQLGGRSGGLTDVDIDCAEALGLANDILPATEAIFGRRSKPRSHRLYVTDLCTTDQKATIRFAHWWRRQSCTDRCSRICSPVGRESALGHGRRANIGVRR